MQLNTVLWYVKGLKASLKYFCIHFRILMQKFTGIDN